ncbi:hypothetical protein BC936DRAFT_147884, partial [Jimgerdemannia flammicorona]
MPLFHSSSYKKQLQWGSGVLAILRWGTSTELNNVPFIPSPRCLARNITMSVLTHHDIVHFESIATKDAAFDLDLYSLLAIVILTAANQPEYVTAVVERRLRALGESVSSKALFLTRVREALLKASLLCGFPRVGQLENVIDFVINGLRCAMVPVDHETTEALPKVPL